LESHGIKGFLLGIICPPPLIISNLTFVIHSVLIKIDLKSKSECIGTNIQEMAILSINATLSQREYDSQSQRENDSQPQRDDDSQSQREDGYQSQRDDDYHNFLKGQRESIVLQLDELGTTVSGLKTTNREQETTIAQQGITITGLI
jgi:hypothetical protein